MKKLSQAVKKNKSIIINSFLAGIFIGFMIFVIIRLVAYQPEDHTHYHANWAVYINGRQQTFTDPSFYEETTTCDLHEDNNPIHRVHMHDEVYEVVHVHAVAVTWRQFFENIGITADSGYLRIKNDIYENNGSKISYILNGQKLDSLNGKVINSEDKLLINYGPESEEIIMQRYNNIQNRAAEYNQKLDPASCSGIEEPTFEERFRHILR